MPKPAETTSAHEPRAVRLLVPWSRPTPGPRLTALLERPEVAAVLLGGAALADATALRALSAAIHSASAAIHSAGARGAGGSGPTLPPLVVLDAHAGATPDGLRPPDPRHLALDLAAGGEGFEVTLEVLTWARTVAAAGVDLVLSPRLDRSTQPLDDPDLAARLAGSWTEALLAAGLVACAGPVCAGDADDDDGWAPFGAALAHGLESVFFADGSDAASLDGVRRRADELVVISPQATSAEEAAGYRAAGFDLIRLDESLFPEEIDALLDATNSDTASSDTASSDTALRPGGTNRVDALREGWLV